MFQKLTNHVYLFPAGKNDRPNVCLIVGDKFSLLREAGFSISHVAELKHAIATQNLPLPDYIVLSHSHADHVLGCCAWEGIPVICEKNTHNILKEMSTWEWSESAIQRRVDTGNEIPFMKAMIMQEFQDPECEVKVVTGNLVFEGCFEIALGEDIHIELIQCNSPHCLDSILAFIREDRLLLISDSDGKDLYSTPWVYNGNFRESTQIIPYDPERVRDYISTLNKIPFLFYIDGHTPTFGYSEYLYKTLYSFIYQEEYDKCSEDEMK